MQRFCGFADVDKSGAATAGMAMWTLAAAALATVAFVGI